MKTPTTLERYRPLRHIAEVEQDIKDRVNKQEAGYQRLYKAIFNPEKRSQLQEDECYIIDGEEHYCDGYPFCNCDYPMKVFGTVERTHSMFDCPDSKVITIEPIITHKKTHINGNLTGIESVNMLGPNAPVVKNEKGGLQSHVEGAFDCLPAKAIIEVAKVLAEGKKKYGKDNWKQIESESHLNHILQHAMAYMSGDSSEGELGHLSHLACRALMCLEMKIEELGG